MSEGQELESVLQETGAPSEGEVTTPSPEPETFTKEQVEKLKLDLRNEVGGEWGRKLKEATSRADRSEVELKQTSGRLNEIESHLAKLKAEEDRKELEAANGDPNRTSLIKLRQQIKDEEAKILKERRDQQKEREQLAEDMKEVSLFKLSKIVGEVASRYESGDAETLIEITDGTPEKMEAAAKRLWKAKVVAQPKVDTQTIQPANLEASRHQGDPNRKKFEGMTIISKNE